MADPHEKLAEPLEALEAPQARDVVAVRSNDLTWTHGERLVFFVTSSGKCPIQKI